MNQRQITSIEKLVGTRLPDEYAQLLCDYPKQLATVYPNDRAPDEKELFCDSKSIISVNTLMRNPKHLIDPDDPESLWPTQYLIIGMDIGGNFYCLKLDSKRTPIYFWFHETNEFEKFAKNLDEFVRKLIARYSDRGQ